MAPKFPRIRVRKTEGVGSRILPGGVKRPMPTPVMQQGAGARMPYRAPMMQRPQAQGVGQGDFCATNCPVDGNGVKQHRCGIDTPQNVQVFTSIATDTPNGSQVTLTYTVTTTDYCPEFFMLPDSLAANWKVIDIQAPSGDSMLLGTNDVLGEFFSSKNERGNRIEGCCVPGGLAISVTLENISGTTQDNIQGSFWGAAH